MAIKKLGSRKRQKADDRRNRPNAKAHYEGATLISVAKSRRITGLGSSLSYKLAQSGTLPTVLVNGRRFVHVPRLMQWLNGGAEGAA
jgi:hypothetical protein